MVKQGKVIEQMFYWMNDIIRIIAKLPISEKDFKVLKKISAQMALMVDL